MTVTIEVQAFPQGGFSCSACDTIDQHATDCPHVLAKKVLSE